MRPREGFGESNRECVGTDLYPRIVPWVGCGLSFGHQEWARGPGVSKPSSRVGDANNKGGSAAPFDGAHLLVQLPLSDRHRTHHCHRHLHSSSGGRGFPGFNRRARVVVGTWSEIVPGHLIAGNHEANGLPFVFHLAPVTPKRNAIQILSFFPELLDFLCALRTLMCPR